MPRDWAPPRLTFWNGVELHAPAQGSSPSLVVRRVSFVEYGFFIFTNLLIFLKKGHQKVQHRRPTEISFYLPGAEYM